MTHRLRNRMVAAFALFSLLSAAVFGVLGIVFVYTVEDSFFDRMLEREARHQRDSWAATGRPAPPLQPGVTLHASSLTFPADLRARFREGGGEFAGADGRHYHVRAVPFAPAGRQAYLVAEVSRELVVRPQFAFILAVLSVAALALLALTLACGYWLARRATRPLEELARLVGQSQPAALPQGFAARFPDNEIGALAQALEQALARAADLVERERSFTRDASHELRTPLAIIKGACALIDTTSLDAGQAARVQRIRLAAGQMAQAVDTLLALAREELGNVPCEPVGLLALAEQAVVDCAHLLDGKAVTVRVEVPREAVAMAHRAALAIVLGNLVANAFAHTASGTVTIAWRDGALLVEDTGPGIGTELRERLFEPGAKGAGSAGTGLGLSITQRLARRVGIGLEIGATDGGGTCARLGLAGAQDALGRV